MPTDSARQKQCDRYEGCASDTVMAPRRIERVHVTPDFRKAYRKLPKRIQTLADRKDAWFRRNPFDPRLRTHKLAGPLQGRWAYSVNREYRVLFRFLSAHDVLYYDIGTHQIYR